MSINRKSYPIVPIEIQVEDNGKYADIAFLVDRYDFMDEVARLRNTWISDELIENDAINEFINLDRNVASTKHFWNHYLEIRKIAKKFGLGVTYVSPILAATLSGVVTDLDYTTLFKEKVVKGLPDDIELDEEATFTSHRVREVDKTTQIDDTKAIGTVKRDREWYWLYQKMGYKKLSMSVNETMETVRSAINSYKNKLENYHRVV